MSRSTPKVTANHIFFMFKINISIMNSIMSPSQLKPRPKGKHKRTQALRHLNENINEILYILVSVHLQYH